MWRGRGLRPCRGPRCCSTSRVVIRRALKSQLHDGCVSADSSTSHVDQARNSLALQVSLQQLPPRVPERQHALPLHGPISPGDGVEHPALPFPERPAAGDVADRGCDCAPSTSASTSAPLIDALNGSARWRSQNSRHAAALTRRITRTQSTAELQAVVKQYRTQLNPIHVAAAIVKLAKLTAAETGRRRPRHGLVPLSGQHSWREVLEHPPSSGFAGAATECDASAAQDERDSGRAGMTAPRMDENGGVLAADTLRRARLRGDDQVSGSSTRISSSRLQIGLSSTSGDSAVCSSAIETSQQGNSGSGSGDGHFFSLGGGTAAAGINLGTNASPVTTQGNGERARRREAQLPMSHPQQNEPSARVPSAADLLLADLVPGFLSQLPHYTGRQFANVVWALGTMGSRGHPELLRAAAAQLQAQDGAKLLAARPQELSNLALGLAKLGYREVPLWAAIIAAGKRRLHEFKPQELHNMAWAVATASQDRSMISAAVQAALPQLRNFNASGLANLLWACAAAQCPCEELFDDSAAALMALPPEELNCQDVANTAWACAKLQHNHPQLMAHLARLVLAAAVSDKAAPGGPRRPTLHGAATQELVNLLWAFAVLPLPLSLEAQNAGKADISSVGARGDGTGQVEGSMARGMGAGEDWVALGRNVPGFGREGPSGLTESPAEGWLSPWLPGLPVSSAPAALGSSHAGLSSAAAVWLPAHVDGSSDGDGSIGAAQSSGGSSRADGVACGSSGGSLLESVVRVLLLELSQRTDISPQGASNALWACARLQPCPLPVAALAALLDVSRRCCTRMSDQEISNTLWAVAELRSAGMYLPYGAVEPVFVAACCATRLETAAPAALAQLVHAAVALRRVPTPHMDLLAQHVMARLPALGPQELCVLAVAVAEAVRTSRYCNPILLNGLANAAVACVGEMCPQAISTLLWSFARAKHYHGPLTTALCRAAKPRLRDFSDLEISNLVWALAVLKCQDRQLLVQAARVLVERVRLRRQRRAVANAVLGLQDQQPKRTPDLQQQQQQDQLLRQQLLSPVHQHALQEEDGEEGSRRSALGQLLSEREEMEFAWASHRQQQQQRRRRRQQQQQQQQQQQLQQQQQAAQQSEDVDPALASGISVSRRPMQAAAAAASTGAAGGDRPGVEDGLTWRRGSWDGPGVKGEHVIQTRGDDAVTSAVSAASPPAGLRANALAAAVAVRPGRPAAAEGPTLSQPEARLRLRRLPYLHNHHDNSSDAETPLQPRRPALRDSGGEAAGNGRQVSSASSRAGGGSGGGSLDASFTGVPLCRGLSDAASSLTQRAVSSTDDSDADLVARGVAGGGRAGGSGGGAADPPTPCDHAKSMSKLLWAYAKCNLYNQSLFRLLTHELQPVLRHTTPHELTLSLWAVACHGHRCPEFLDAAAGLLLRGRLRELCAWDGSVVAWAFAKLGHEHRALFEALQQHARDAGPRYKEPCLLRLAWACAALEVPLNEDLLRRVVEVKQQVRRRVVHSSYDGADGEPRTAVDAARAEGDW